MMKTRFEPSPLGCHHETKKTSHPGFELSRAPASETVFSLFCHWTIKAVDVKIPIEGTNLPNQ